MLTEDKITEIIVMADEFCKVFDVMHRCREFLMGKVTVDSEIQGDKRSEGTKVFFDAGGRSRTQARRACRLGGFFTTDASSSRICGWSDESDVVDGGVQEAVAEPRLQSNCRDMPLGCCIGNQYITSTCRRHVPTIWRVLQHPLDAFLWTYLGYGAALLNPRLSGFYPPCVG